MTPEDIEKVSQWHDEISNIEEFATFTTESDMEQLLSDITGMHVKLCDAKIDDGIDDEEDEDEYVMKSSFSIGDKNIYVDIYYGNVTGIIGYARVSE